MDSQSQVLGHDIVRFYGINACLFQVTGKLSQCLVIVQTAAVSQTARPGKDGGDRVGGCRVTLWDPRNEPFSL